MRRRMQNRPFRPADAEALTHVFYDAVHQVAAQYYSPEQIAAWVPERPPAERYLARGADGRLILVAADEADRPVAYVDLEADGHIDHLFCRPEQAGRGVTGALYAALEAEARARGLSRLYVEASEPAKRFFLRQGFSVVTRRDFEVRGVPIHNWAMEKRLDAPA
ncbi:MAG TPA: GNAT family N-acetyltransferase [Caulobacteraceae bacterium]|nr:GNAT family N-acetyltransferase [Caulobacteraceae bacterium]